MADYAEGVYVVSAQLNAAGIEGTLLSWGASKGVIEGGAGLASGLEAVTREFSRFGTGASSDSPARAYADAIKDTDAYDQSRDCAEDG